METREELNKLIDEKLLAAYAALKRARFKAMALTTSDSEDKYKEIKEIIVDAGADVMCFLGETIKEIDETFTDLKNCFDESEIVAAGIGPDGSKYRLVRFLPEHYDIQCKGATVEEIKDKFPGYEIEPTDDFVYTYLIEKDGELILD